MDCGGMPGMSQDPLRVGIRRITQDLPWLIATHSALCCQRRRRITGTQDMATIYRKKYPIPMPEGSEVLVRRGKRLARWHSGKGQARTAEVLDDGRVQFVSDCWYARYRDADGVDRRVSTGCRDEQTARKVLADLLSEAEKVKTGILTPNEKAIAAHGQRPLRDHLEEYLAHLVRKRVRGRKVSPRYCANVRGRLARLFDECRFSSLRDIAPGKVECWLEGAEGKGLSPATRNEYLISLSAFCAWAVKNDRLSANPAAGIGKADRNADRRHVWRALTVEEVAQLLDAARRRPIAEAGRIPAKLPEEARRGRSSWTLQPLTVENLDRCHQAGLERLAEQAPRRRKLERLGRQRALFYLLAVATGLRRRELVSLTVGQVHLSAVPTPYLSLNAADSKNARAANVPLRPDVASQLRACLAGRERSLEAKLFERPPTIRVFDADIRAAGIAKKDPYGRVVDIHALRHTFGTHLSASGVHPRTAMAAMRHSRIELTMNYYTDPILLDVAGAVNSLPAFDKFRQVDSAPSPTGVA